jgi:hypothetical protein
MMEETISPWPGGSIRRRFRLWHQATNVFIETSAGDRCTSEEIKSDGSPIRRLVASIDTRVTPQSSARQSPGTSAHLATVRMATIHRPIQASRASMVHAVRNSSWIGCVQHRERYHRMHTTLCAGLLHSLQTCANPLAV